VKLLGEAFVSAFTIVKEAEYEVFLQVISSWKGSTCYSTSECR